MRSFLSNLDFSFGNLFGFSFFFHVNSFLSSKDLNVSLWRKIRTDSTVGSVSSSAALSSSINLNVINRKIFKIFSIGVGLEVIYKTQNNLYWFLRPPSKGFSELSGLTSSTDSSVVFSIRYTSSMSQNILKILFGLGNWKAFNSLSSLIGVFIMNSEVSSWRFSD